MQLQACIDKNIFTPLTPYDKSMRVSGLSTDSRLVEPGGMFIAIPGNVMNGLDFVEEAIKKGATCVLVQEEEASDCLNTSQLVPIFGSRNVRKAVAQLAAQFYPCQPEQCVAITGTNGKSSTVSFLRQLWVQLGVPAASLGTLGIEVEGVENPFPQDRNTLTTPDVLTLHDRLQVLKEKGVDHVAFEASSHGLDQYRLDGVNVKVAAFTNFSQDHLDYHHTLRAYFQAKLRLFTECLDPKGVAVINLADPKGQELLYACRERGVKTLTLGTPEADLCIHETYPVGEGQHVSFSYSGKRYEFTLPLPGAYQVDNIMIAIGVLLAQSFHVNDILKACQKLKPIPGRLEPAAPGVYVDYAHTPEALKSAIKAVPHKPGHLWVVFGCGGDRDPDKRPIMGEVVAGSEFEGKIIITDDNPRTEDPAQIRRDILQGVPHAWEIGDRRRAIQAAMTMRGSEDKVLIAGKGHETYQIIGEEILDFDDRKEVRRSRPLWTSREAEAATGGSSEKGWRATGVSIDTRTLKPGDLFVALKGEHSDGHNYIDLAFEKGAAAVVISKEMKVDGPALFVDDTLRALQDLGEFARDRAVNARRIAITGSVGKTTVKEMLKLGLSSVGLTHASVASYNNHWGVPLTLARMPEHTEFAIFEVGMNHPNEITPLSKMIAPHVAAITTVAASHLGHFESIREIAKAKAEIFDGLGRNGVAILNGGNEYFDDLSSWAAEVGISHILEVSRRDTATACISADSSQVNIEGQVYPLDANKFGTHLAENEALCLLIASVVSDHVFEACNNMKRFRPVSGRGETHKVDAGDFSFTLIDESYNANPASMVAALRVLGRSKQKRKVAIIGDMRELGEDSSQLHEELIGPIQDNCIDKVFCCGPYMAGLYEKLPSHVKGGYTEVSVELIPIVKAALEEGDVVMVKGSLGTKMKPIIEALLAMRNHADMKVAN